jgi:hypothetical protein
LSTSSAAAVDVEVLTEADCEDELLRLALEVTTIFKEPARFAVFNAAALVVTTVLTEQARFAVFDAAPLMVAVVSLEPAKINAVFDTSPLVVATVETLPANGMPRITCAEIIAEEAPATLKFLVSVAFAVGLTAPVTTPASDAVFKRGAAAIAAAQLTDAASDCNAPSTVLPFKLVALSAEPFKSTRHLAN